MLNLHEGALAALVALAAVLPPASSAAAGIGDLYQAQAVVTGTGEKNRQPGFRQCLEDVLVKVSGDPRLIGDPAAAALLARADTLVASFSYRDRLAGIPIHDEQGSYDRPHDLTCIYEPDAIDAALRSLGRAPWTAPRPRVVVFLGVRKDGEAYVLAQEGEGNPDMRLSLAAAAGRVGIPMLLPKANAVAKFEVTLDALASPDLAGLERAAKESGGDIAVVGTLVWSDEALGWIADWRIRWQGRTYRWSIRGVGFDDAFRNGIRGTAQVLSGNGEPSSDPL